MSLNASYLAIFVINIILLLIFHFLFIKFFPGTTKNKFLLLLTVFFYPSIANLIVGQHTTIILLIFLSIYLALRKERSFWAGLTTSLLIIKPQYTLFTPFSLYLSKNKKQYILGFVLGILIFWIFNLVIMGSIKPFLDYPNFILSTENPEFGSRPYQMFTLYGLVKQIAPLTKNEILVIGNYVLYGIFTLLTIYKTKKLKSFGMLFTAGIILTILFSIHALTHDLLVLLVPLYIGIVNRTKLRGIILSLFAIPLITLLPSSARYSFASLGVLFMFLIFLQTIYSKPLNN